jgi:predicted deacylase
MPGDRLQEGQTIARIRNPFGDTLEEVASPHDGIMLGYPIFDNQAVRTGEMLIFIGRPKN